MKPKSLVIIGAGGHACVIAEAAMLSGWNVSGHVAPNCGSEHVLGDYLGSDAIVPDLISQGKLFAIGIGFVNTKGATVRDEILNTIPKEKLASIVHPTAIISPNAEIATGVFVAAGAVVNSLAKVEAAAIVNTGTIIEHHCQIGANTHIATGAQLTGNVSIGKNTLVGSGAVIRQGISVGENSVLGAGSVLLQDMPSNSFWAGNPARALKQ